MERYQMKECMLSMCFLIDRSAPSDDVCFALFRIHSVAVCYVDSAIGVCTEKQGLERIKRWVLFSTDYDTDGLNCTVLMHLRVFKEMMLMVVLSIHRRLI